MSCGFCFAQFEDVKKNYVPKGHLSKENSINLIKQLAEYGFKKITFVGGEPGLCPWLTELILTAKNNGFTTMLVTNGSPLTDYFLIKNQNQLDWICLSIDSINPETNKFIGRTIKGKPLPDAEYYLKKIKLIKKYDYRFKINTVVNSFNKSESLLNFIDSVKPERWKILQALYIAGENDLQFEKFQITEKEFNEYLKFKYCQCC